MSTNFKIFQNSQTIFLQYSRTHVPKFYDTLELMSRLRRQNLRVGLLRSHRCLLSPLAFCIYICTYFFYVVSDFYSKNKVGLLRSHRCLLSPLASCIYILLYVGCINIAFVSLFVCLFAFRILQLSSVVKGNLSLTTISRQYG